MTSDSSNSNDSPDGVKHEPPTESSASGAPTDGSGTGSSVDTLPRGPRVFGRFAFWIVAFPFIVYLVGMMTGGYLETMRQSFLSGDLAHHEEESTRPKEEVDISGIEAEALEKNERYLLGLLPLGENSYPHTYTFTIMLTTGLMLLFGWGYFKAPFRVSPLSFAVGAIGFVVWVGLAYLDREFIGLGETLSSGRTAFNPFVEMDHWSKDQIWRFLAVRFFGLVIIVPIIEEFFIRGFLIRYVDDPDWDEIPLGQAKTMGWLSPTIYGVVAHMTEPLAAFAWFSLVTWLYKRTGSIWDCVIAHAVTNLMLGLYVLKFEQWHLW